jgi:hypothetical protein
VLAVQIVSFVLIFVLARYRMVAVACLLPFAAKQIEDLVRWFRSGETSKLRSSAILLIVFAAIAFVPFSEFPADRGFADQYKFLADDHLRHGRFSPAAESYREAIDSDWQDGRRTQLLRWECMMRLAQSEIPLGRFEASRQALEALLTELGTDPSGAAYESAARRLLEQLDFLEGAASEPAAGVPVDS